MGRRRFYTCLKRPLASVFRADARESAEIVSGRLFWGFSLFDSVTYISVGSLYSKAPIWSGLKMSRWCLRFLRQWKAARKAHTAKMQSLFPRTQIYSENPCQGGCKRAEITAETVCDGAKTKQCPAAIDDSSLLCPPSNPSAQGEKPENLHRSSL